MKALLFACATTLFTLPLAAQTLPVQLTALPPVARFDTPDTGKLSILQEINPAKPFSVLGPRGALLGQQDGTFEGWIFPWKLFRDMRISARMQDYNVPIDVNEYASTIDVQPDRTTITFAHANFTIREVLFAPNHPADGSGVAAYFEVQAIRPMDITFSFTPEMKCIWPAESDDVPSPEWVATSGGSGFYMLHLNFPDHASALAIPGAQPGILAPYQEHAKVYPLQFVVHFDPKKDAQTVYPLLMATADTAQTATKQNFDKLLLDQDTNFAKSFADNHADYVRFLAEHTAIETPDRKLNDAFRWAELSINQLRVETIPSHSETALVAGFVSSGDTARPGFGWFFGRDALWSLYAVNSYGDLKLSREEIEFLLKRQKSDGKIMHEWSQAADLVDWARLPYEWASADATPLLLMEMQDYLAISGDKAFIEKHWDALAKAWQFETTHDSDGDGIYENTEGSAWVESWPPGMPHQEIYLAAVDQQASTAFAKLAQATGHSDLAAAAQRRADHIKAQIEKEYYLPKTQSYAFSRNPDGSTDDSATIFPSVAWWDGSLALDKAGPLMTRWASSEFSTDWGTRDLSPATAFYDPISYHQGTVWPLYTGWVSLAEYRTGRSLSGYAHMEQNANMTWSQDLGNVTELLSGEYFRPLGRSTAHQLWSSAMVVTPIVRGLFGISWDAARNTISIAPNLPADWDHAAVRRLALGTGFTDLEFTRKGRDLAITASNGVHLESTVKGARQSGGALLIPLPPVEVFIASALPVPGDVTHQMKVLDQTLEGRSLTLRLSAPGGSRQRMQARVNDEKLRVQMNGRPLQGEALQPIELSFPQGSGYVEQTIRFTW